ncbi:protein of unknown function [Shinella sp. WSC3-e]|nr:hypothetical protein SHINE37_42396 [Rhizobiaceae bacterium]CAK7256983.1 protein of unknown function [Shinella sp. WSC3-e]
MAFGNQVWNMSDTVHNQFDGPTGPRDDIVIHIQQASDVSG